MKPKIVKHNGQWCVSDPYICSDEPKMFVHHWPIGSIAPPIRIDRFEGQEVEKRGAYTGSYALRVAPYQWSTIYLAELGKTQSIDTQVVLIPCPKVRKGVETRYRHGYWQKYLKSKGWISI